MTFGSLHFWKGPIRHLASCNICGLLIAKIVILQNYKCQMSNIQENCKIQTIKYENTVVTGGVIHTVSVHTITQNGTISTMIANSL